MKMHRFLSAGVCCLLFTVSVKAQKLSHSDKEWHDVKAINALAGKYVVAKQLNKLTSLYDNSVAYLPEFFPVIYATNGMKGYWKGWNTFAETVVYDHAITALERSGSFLLEYGKFNHHYISMDPLPYKYTGKYFRVWQIKGKEYRIISECWGADYPVDRSNTYSYHSGSPLPGNNPRIISSESLDKIRQQNQVITQFVTQRNGIAHAKLFTEDAVYMPYYDGIKQGMEAIKTYFEGHEKPGDVTIDSLVITTGAFRKIAGLYFEQGNYTVRWRNSTASGIVSGKSINIWKTDKNGKPKIYRQIVNHD